MKQPGETNTCTDLKALYTFYSIPQAAVLWCGVPEDQVEEIIQEAKTSQEAKMFSPTGLGGNIWIHPAHPSLEYKSRAIAMALEDSSLPFVRGDEWPPYAHVPLEYRLILGRDLKEWMEKEFPDERPAFLFGETKSDPLKAILGGPAGLSERSERTYQRIIAVLLKCIEGELPGLVAHPSFASEAKLIETIVEHFPKHEGLSQRTLQRKFPEAKRALKSC